jgi:hypothetical protein
MLLAYGHKYLESHPDPGFRRQYEYRIDHFALGVLSLEVVFTLWNGQELNEGSEHLGAPLGVASRRALAGVRAAWRSYWTDAVGLFQKFHSDGGATLREALTRSQAVCQLVAKLRLLCTALREAAARVPGGSAAPVFRAATNLLDWHGGLSWEALPGLLAARPSVDGAAEEQETPIASPVPSPRECRWQVVGGELGPSFYRKSVAMPKDVRGSTGASERRTVALGSEGEPSSRISLSPQKTVPHIHGRHLRLSSVPSVPTTPATVFRSLEPSSGQVVKLLKVSGQQGSDATEDGTGAADATPRALVYSTPSPKLLGHRRLWTVDEAVSLARGVPQVGVNVVPSPPPSPPRSTRN